MTFLYTWLQFINTNYRVTYFNFLRWLIEASLLPQILIITLFVYFVCVAEENFFHLYHTFTFLFWVWVWLQVWWRFLFCKLIVSTASCMLGCVSETLHWRFIGIIMKEPLMTSYLCVFIYACWLINPLGNILARINRCYCKPN
jgi:hypothetical protein